MPLKRGRNAAVGSLREDAHPGPGSPRLVLLPVSRGVAGDAHVEAPATGGDAGNDAVRVLHCRSTRVRIRTRHYQDVPNRKLPRPRPTRARQRKAPAKLFTPANVSGTPTLVKYGPEDSPRGRGRGDSNIGRRDTRRGDLERLRVRGVVSHLSHSSAKSGREEEAKLSVSMVFPHVNALRNQNGYGQRTWQNGTVLIA